VVGCGERVKEHAELSELYTMVAAVFFKCLVLKKWMKTANVKHSKC